MLFVAGQRLTAAQLNSIAPAGTIKGADESLASSATLQNDNELFVACVANATYLFRCFLDYEAAATIGLKWTWSVPSGTLRYAATYLANTTGTPPVVGALELGSGTVGAGGNGTGNLMSVLMEGTLVTSSAMTLTLQWAQNTSSATATIVHAQSSLAVWRMS